RKRTPPLRYGRKMNGAVTRLHRRSLLAWKANGFNGEGTMAKLKTRKMYHVEKFLPPECPKCRARFQQESKDYALFLGDIIDGKKTIWETNGYRIIVCAHCKNMTACWPLESYLVGDRKKAEALVKNQ